MDDDGSNRSGEMTGMAMDTTSQQDLAQIETDTRFFMRLLVAAGIAAAATVACGVVWHESELAGGAPPVEQTHSQPAD
jgi:hypothetical protein